MDKQKKITALAAAISFAGTKCMHQHAYAEGHAACKIQQCVIQQAHIFRQL
jgi:hypothetical protein